MFNSSAWILSVILPGLGQAVEGRLFRGLLLLAIASIGINLTVMGIVVFEGDTGKSMLSWGLGTFGVIWVLSLIEMFHFRHTNDARKHEPELARHLQNAMGYYLARDLEKARDELKAMLRLAPHDIEAHMYLASVYREMGDRKKALATFHKVALLDENGKWGWQLEREVKELGS